MSTRTEKAKKRKSIPPFLRGKCCICGLKRIACYRNFYGH
jgi:hypothetical protein